MSGIDALKDSMTPAAKLYNWNVITKALDAYDVHEEDDVKNLIVAGDLQLLVELLEQIRKKEGEFSGSAPEGNEDEEKEMVQQRPVASSTRGGKSAKTRDKQSIVLLFAFRIITILGKSVVDIANSDINKQPDDIDNCLEFILVTMSRAFNLKPKQAAGLLTDSNKYLSHILVKGLKGDFAPVTAWLSDVYELAETFSSLIKVEEDANSMHMVLNAFKGGLYSKDSEVTTWTMKIFSKLMIDLYVDGTLKQAWEWYISVDGGLDGTVYALQRHTGLEEICLDLMINIGRGNLYELFTNYYKNLIKDPVQYLRTILSFVKPLASLIGEWQESDKEELEKVIQFWLDAACRQSDNDGRHTVDERAVSLSLLSEIWIYLPYFVEQKEEISNHVLTMLKRSTRDKNIALQLFSISHLFNLLETFANSKNQHAPIIYKALTFSLVENHQVLPIREFIMENFILLFKTQPGVPVGILLEPLAKQIQLSENNMFLYNLMDFEFFNAVADNPKLPAKSMIQLLDILAKIMLSEPLFIHAAKTPFFKVMIKALEYDEAVQGFMQKFIKVSLSTLLGIVKKKYPLNPKV